MYPSRGTVDRTRVCRNPDKRFHRQRCCFVSSASLGRQVSAHDAEYMRSEVGDLYPWKNKESRIVHDKRKIPLPLSGCPSDEGVPCSSTTVPDHPEISDRFPHRRSTMPPTIEARYHFTGRFSGHLPVCAATGENRVIGRLEQEQPPASCSPTGVPGETSTPPPGLRTVEQPGGRGVCRLNTRTVREPEN